MLASSSGSFWRAHFWFTLLFLLFILFFIVVLDGLFWFFFGLLFGFDCANTVCYLRFGLDFRSWVFGHCNTFSLRSQSLHLDARHSCVEVVPIEQGLDRVSSQQESVLSHLITVRVLPIFRDVLCIEVIDAIVGDVFTPDDARFQVIEVETLEPWVALHLLRTLETEAMFGFS